jgi:hypothetical protein
MRPAKLQEVAKIAPSRPIKLAFDFFVVDPEDVRCDNLNSTRLHFQELVFPALLRIPREVKLTHDGEPRSAIQREISTVDPASYEELERCFAALRLSLRAVSRVEPPLSMTGFGFFPPSKPWVVLLT